MSGPPPPPAVRRRRRLASEGESAAPWMKLSSTILLLCALLKVTDASVPCNTTEQCQTTLLATSECNANGFCTNPYTTGGCLANRIPGHTQLRVCHSRDPPDAEARGLCRRSRLDHMEVRILSQNWESGFFEAWILQILLSEFLDVPATIETGVPGYSIDFYDPDMPLDYGTSNDWDALRQANKVGDCRLSPNKPCAHVLPEVWNPRLSTVLELEAEGVIEPHQFLGVIGEQAWFIPRYTGERDPTLVTYLGLSGEENREKLARIFKRPTKWGDYCAEETLDNCTAPDDTAMRAPRDEAEADRIFVDGLYHGYFRHTDENNCTANPTTCTGHIADFPCTWASFVSAQTYWLNISLASSGESPGSNGYTYQQLIDIWAAANHNKEDIIMHWWRPEALYERFLGTDAEFLKVSLPPPTQDCIDARIRAEDRCSDDFELQVGQEEGSCDEAHHPLMKLVTTSLYAQTYAGEIPEARRSPAYDAVKDFRINGLQLGKIFEGWLSSGIVDRWNFAPRDATCRWVTDNLEFVQSFVPRTFPRVIKEENHWNALSIATASVGGFALLLVVSSMVYTYRRRERRVVRFAQIEFMFLLLSGLLLVSMAAFMSAFQPSDGSCVAVVWLVNMGYTLELVPLIVKIAAINRLMHAAQQMRRVKLERRNLFGVVVVLSCLVVTFMILWTAIDPPRRDSDYTLTSKVTDEGEYVVSQDFYCASNSKSWKFISAGSQLILLLIAGILAFQTRNLRKDINESQTLAILIYSHFVFVLLRLISFFLLEKNLDDSKMEDFQGLIFGTDTIATILIYFVPKFCIRDEDLAANPSAFASNTIARIIGNLSLGDRASKIQSNNSVQGEEEDPEQASSIAEAANDDPPAEIATTDSEEGDSGAASSIGPESEALCSKCGEPCS